MLTLNEIGHEVAGRSLFHHLNFSFGPRKYGLVGPNGIGKTTLAKILAGVTPPALGRVQRDQHVLYFSQSEAPTDVLLSEYLAAVWEVPHVSSEIFGPWVSQLDFKRRVSDLSSGEWMKARLLKAIAEPATFLILDEPSNNLDVPGKDLLTSFLRHYRDGLLLISHDRALLDEMDTIVEMSNQGLTAYGGNFTFYWEQREIERERQQDQLAEAKRLSKKAKTERLEKLERQQKRMREGARKTYSRGLPKILAGARQRRAQVSMGKLEKQEKNIGNQAHERALQARNEMKADAFLRLDFEGAAVPPGKLILSARDFNWRFNNQNAPLWTSPIAFEIKGPQRWHLQGANGSGKSTLIKCITRSKELVAGHARGFLKVHATAVAYFDQKCSLLKPSASIIENIQEGTRFSESGLRSELAFYGFTGETVFQKVYSLSGGELFRAALAKMFLGAQIPELIILDEPTNNLDFQCIELLESALQKYEGALLVVSHDGKFIEALEVTNTFRLDSH